MADTESKADKSADKAIEAASQSVSGETSATKKTVARKTAPAKAAKPKPAPRAKTATAKPKPTRKPARKATPKKAAPAKVPVAAKPVAAVKTSAAAMMSSVNSIPLKSAFKDKVMDMNKNLKSVQDMLGQAQKKAQEAFEKSTAFAGDYSEFAKGNVEAFVESGKILAEGLQDIGTNLVAESRTAFEAMSADMKDMAAAKSPTELLQVQSDMVRKNFDSAVAYGSKNTEAMVKLASDVIAPISERMNVAVEKVTKAA